MGSNLYSESYTYNSSQDGSLNTHTTATGQTLTYHYDSLRRLSSITGGIYGKSYTYRYLNNTTQTTSQAASVVYDLPTDQSFRYTYNDMGNIATYTDANGTVTYTYDDLGQLKKAAGTTTYSYTYDSAGNILTANGHSYTYGDAEWRDLLTKFDGVDITYDSIGNPTSYYNGTQWTFSWEHGRMLSTASGGGSSISYTYDADGIRTSKTVNGTKHTYYYAGGKLLRETFGDHTLDFFYDASGNPYALKHNGTIYYYITNLQGDVMSIVNGSGTVVASYQYDPFGNLVSDEPTANSIGAINPLRYRGYVYDTESRLYYLQSRYYDSKVGRFINADALVSTGLGILGFNMFAYCNNNPATYLDPTGTRIAFWYQLFEDHDPGYLHRVVQADIFVKHNLQAMLYDTEYVMPGIGRADIVCLSTGEMWEIKHGGSNAAGWENGLAAANAQLERYAEKGSALRKGRANMFSGSVVVGFGDMQYIVHYETPEVGVILYTLERKYEYESQVAYRYAPHTLYDYKKQLMGSFGIMLGLGVLSALHVNLQENTRGVGWR